MALFKYKGETFSLPNVQSNEKELALSKIKDHIAKTRSEGILQETAEGVASGVIGIAEGLAETGASLYDFAADTNYAQEVTDFGKELRKNTGIDPVGIGKFAEVLTQFAIPGLGVAGAIGRSKKIKDLGVGVMRAAQVAGAGAVDALVATDGMTTIGDFFGGGPTLTEKDIGLEGKEEAARRIRNKLKFGAEAAGFTGSLYTLFKATSLASPALAGAVKGTGAGLKRIAPKVEEALDVDLTRTSKELKGAIRSPLTLAEKIAPVSTERLKALFRSRGLVTQEIFEKGSKLRGQLEAQLNKAAYTVRDLEKEMDKVFKNVDHIEVNGTKLDKIQSLNLLYGFLTKDRNMLLQFIKDQKRLSNEEIKELFVGDVGKKVKDIKFRGVQSTKELAEAFLPKWMQKSAITMRSQLDNFSESIRKSKLVSEGVIEDAEGVITANLGRYITRKYDAFAQPNWFNSDLYKKRRAQARRHYTENHNETKKLYEAFIGPIPDDFTIPNVPADRVNPTRVDELLKQIEERYDPSLRRKLHVGFGDGSPDPSLSRIAKDRLNTGLVSKRRVDDEMLRKLLGEVKDPIENYLNTLSDLARFDSVNKYYQFIFDTYVKDGTSASVKKQQVREGNRLFLSSEDFVNTDIVPEVLRNRFINANEYVKLGQDFGVLKDQFVRRDIYLGLTKTKLGDPGDGAATLLKHTYGGFLRLKGATSLAKLMSPFTIARNAISAVGFATANGNVGRGANVFESTKIVLNEIRKRNPADRAQYYRMLQEEGIIGTQTQVREIERLIEDGYGKTIKADLDEVGVDVVKKNIGTRFVNSTPGRFLNSGLEGFKKIYQGGDDIWKIYNFEFEKNKLISALGGERPALQYVKDTFGFDNLNEYAADIVRNLVPNYDRAPDITRFLRLLPLGDFTTFTSEIIRTSANILGRSIQELQSGNEAIKAIGARRLLGFLGTVGASGYGVQSLAMLLTGVSKEALQAVSRILPEWNKNSTLIPTAVDKNGNITEVIDYDYSNPYAYFNKPFRAVLNAYNRGELEGISASKTALNATTEVLSEMFYKPYLQPSIATQLLFDLRRGETETGAKIYKEIDDLGTKSSKMALHVINEMLPAFVERDLGTFTTTAEKGGNIGFVQGRITRSILSEMGFTDEIDPKSQEARNVQEEIVSQFTGLRSIKINPERVVKYKSYKYLDRSRNAKNIFGSAVGVVRKMPPADIINSYLDANEELYQEQRDMFRFIEDMRLLGMKDREIRKALKKNRISNIPELMRGRFVPHTISKKKIKEANQIIREHGGSFPLRQLRAVERKLKRRSLVGELKLRYKPEREVSETPTSPISTVGISLPPNQTTVGPKGAESFPVAAPQVTSDTSVELLGSNPIDALKNLQIAQRQQ